MDPLTAISLFTGYGGIDLGLKRVEPRIRTICYVEREIFAAANLVAKIKAGQMDEAPIWSDIKTFDCSPWVGKVDLLHGGYPCQGFSSAGKREGKRDPRFLWPWVFRSVVAIRPNRVFFENVEGHIALGLSTVISDLEAAGYRCAWGIFSAEECGAPHRRKRVFIIGQLANHSSQRRRESTKVFRGEESVADKQSEELANNPKSRSWRLSEPEIRPTYPNTHRTSEGPMADAMRCERDTGRERTGREAWPNNSGSGQGVELEHAAGISERESADKGNSKSISRRTWNESGDTSKLPDTYQQGRQGVGCDNGTEFSTSQRICDKWPARPGQPQYEFEPPRTVESRLGRDTARSSNRVDRLRLLGNGCVPATVAKAWLTLSGKMTNR